MYNGPQRKSLRLKKFNYSSNGYYFVTICTKEREDFFGEIIDGKMILNMYGKITKNEILQTEKIRKEIQIDEFIIMPNHIHLIIVIKHGNVVGNAGLHSLHKNDNIKSHVQHKKNNTKNILSNSIQRIKSSITRKIRNNYNDFVFGWHKSFYDVIIRNDEQLEKSRNYIINNPSKWQSDINNIS